jgi:hypothetical protein
MLFLTSFDGRTSERRESTSMVRNCVLKTMSVLTKNLGVVCDNRVIRVGPLLVKEF